MAGCTHSTEHLKAAVRDSATQFRLPSATREPDMETNQIHEPWNKGKLVGQKPPLKPKDIWAIRIYLQNDHQLRDLAMFNLAIDSKLRAATW